MAHLPRDFLLGFIENDLREKYNSKIPIFGEKYLETVILEFLQGGV
jgi:hypothetical protein